MESRIFNARGGLTIKNKLSIIILLLVITLSIILCIYLKLTNDNILLNIHGIQNRLEELEAVETVDPNTKELQNILDRLKELEDQQNKTQSGLEEIQGMVNTSVPLPLELQLHTYRECEEYNIPIKIMYALMEQESRFTLDLVSPTNDHGVCQINASNIGWLKRDYGLDIFDYKDNITASCVILRLNLDKAGGDMELALGAYNTGQLIVNNYAKEVLNRMEKMVST